MSRLSTITDYRTEMKFANVGNFCNYMFSAILHSLPIKWPPKEAGGGGGGGGGPRSIFTFLLFLIEGNASYQELFTE